MDYILNTIKSCKYLKNLSFYLGMFLEQFWRKKNLSPRALYRLNFKNIVSSTIWESSILLQQELAGIHEVQSSWPWSVQLGQVRSLRINLNLTCHDLFHQIYTLVTCFTLSPIDKSWGQSQGPSTWIYLLKFFQGTEIENYREGSWLQVLSLSFLVQMLI